MQRSPGNGQHDALGKHSRPCISCMLRNTLVALYFLSDMHSHFTLHPSHASRLILHSTALLETKMWCHNEGCLVPGMASAKSTSGRRSMRWPSTTSDAACSSTSAPVCCAAMLAWLFTRLGVQQMRWSSCRLSSPHACELLRLCLCPTFKFCISCMCARALLLLIRAADALDKVQVLPT